jgi:hypothetical protein
MSSIKQKKSRKICLTQVVLARTLSIPVYQMRLEELSEKFSLEAVLV